MKKILLIAAIAFAFTACNKCVECTHDSAEIQGPSGEDYGDYIQEICSDNFESKDDFNDYIDDLEDYDWECKSDFGN